MGNKRLTTPIDLLQRKCVHFSNSMLKYLNSLHGFKNVATRLVSTKGPSSFAQQIMDIYTISIEILNLAPFVFWIPTVFQGKGLYCSPYSMQ